MDNKICTQCGRQQPLTAFKTYKTKSGIAHRSICHQCAYNNNMFNVLSRERRERPLTDKEAATYDMLLQMFDICYEAGNTIGSGEYNELRNKKIKKTLEDQLAELQEMFVKKREPVDNNKYINEAPSIAIDDSNLKLWFEMTFKDWTKYKYKPSYLRAVFSDLKNAAVQCSLSAGYTSETDFIDAVKVLFTKAWDYEEYLVDTYGTELPDWLEGEELIV